VAHVVPRGISSCVPEIRAKDRMPRYATSASKARIQNMSEVGYLPVAVDAVDLPSGIFTENAA
jgi:hypothetical protein